MTTTATAPETTDRAALIIAAIDNGYDNQKQLMDRLGMPKTTLLNTLTALIEDRRIERVVDGRNVFYRVPSAFDTLRLENPAITAAIKANAAAKAAQATPEQRQAHEASTAAAAAEIAAAAPATRTGRLPKGQAETLILAYLAAHPQDSFGPYELGRAIAPVGHKPLGVRDACARMAQRGQITATQDKPVRYRANTPPQAE